MESEDPRPELKRVYTVTSLSNSLGRFSSGDVMQLRLAGYEDSSDKVMSFLSFLNQFFVWSGI